MLILFLILIIIGFIFDYILCVASSRYTYQEEKVNDNEGMKENEK